MSILSVSIVLNANAVAIPAGASVEQRDGYDGYGRHYPNECNYGTQGYCGLPGTPYYVDQPVPFNSYEPAYEGPYNIYTAKTDGAKVETRGNNGMADISDSFEATLVNVENVHNEIIGEFLGAV